MASLHEITSLKKEVEMLKARVARSKGVIDTLMEKYRGVVDPETFHQCVEALQQRRIEAEQAFTARLEAYRKKYKEWFGEFPPLVCGPSSPAAQPSTGGKKGSLVGRDD